MTVLTTVTQETEFGSWTQFVKSPDPRLAPFVRDIRGYVERGGFPVMRKEMPTGIIPLILVFGRGFSLSASRGDDRPLDRTFLAGLHEYSVLVGSDGAALCMQVDFTPWGARRFLGIGMAELANRVIDLRDILGPAVDRLEERLSEARSWDERFARVELFLLSRIAAGPEADPRTLEAWRMLLREGARVGRVADTLGMSRKHLFELFRRDIGLSPKSVARIVRFRRAVERLQTGATERLADLAFDCGYADQAHFNRDFTAFAGESPGAIRARLAQSDPGLLVG